MAPSSQDLEDTADENRIAEIRSRLTAVRQRMSEAAIRSGRDPAAVTLVAVSKTHPPDIVRAAVQAGQATFGENRIEEAGPKMRSLSGVIGLEWHMIGHVQSRKASDVVGAGFALVHSVDTLKLAERLGRLAAQSGRRQAVLIEINVSGEPSKTGFDASRQENWPDLLPDLRRVLDIPGLEVSGLMTIAPQVDQPAMARPYFDRLRQFRDILAERLAPGPGSVLSMGMSDDFEAAIEAGATLVRIGRAIFGERN